MNSAPAAARTVLRVEHRVLIGGLGGCQLDPPRAPAGVATVSAAPLAARLRRGCELRDDAADEGVREREYEEHDRALAVTDQRDVDQQPDQDVQREALATASATAAAVSATAEAPGAAAGGGERARDDRQHEHGDERERRCEDQVPAAHRGQLPAPATARRGPAPGSVCAMC